VTDEAFGVAKVRLRQPSQYTRYYIFHERTLPAQNETFQGPDLLPEFLLLRGGQSRTFCIPRYAVPRETAGWECVSLRCQVSRKVS